MGEWNLPVSIVTLGVTVVGTLKVLNLLGLIGGSKNAALTISTETIKDVVQPFVDGYRSDRAAQLQVLKEIHHEVREARQVEMIAQAATCSAHAEGAAAHKDIRALLDATARDVTVIRERVGR